MKHNKLTSIIFIFFISLLLSQQALAISPAEKLDNAVNMSIDKFKRDVPGADKFLSDVKGYLVFPSILKGGFVFGAGYGEGALRIEGETKQYYSIASASVGFQAGAQQSSMVIAFITEESLNNFINSDGWEAGVDGTITISHWGASKDITSISYEKPIVAFIFNTKGLMASVSINGIKFRKIIPQ